MDDARRDAGDGALAATSWNLTTLFDGDEPVPASGEEAVLDLRADGALAGSTGCNRFVGTWEDAGPHLTLELGAMTRRAGTDPAIDRQERLLLALLPAVRGYALDGDTLTLRDAAGVPVLVYERGRTDLAGTRWRATGVNDGRGAVVSDASTHHAWIEFGTDGVVSGSGGCNRFQGRYHADLGAVTVDDLVSTRRACDPPLMTLEQRLLDALARTTAFERSGRQLRLRDPEGATQATFVLDPDAGRPPV